MQRLVFYVKTRGFRAVEPFGGSNGALFGCCLVLWYVKIRGFCVRRPVFYVKTQGFRTVGPSGAPLGLCLDVVCSLLAPCGALLHQKSMVSDYKTEVHGKRLVHCSGP